VGVFSPPGHWTRRRNLGSAKGGGLREEVREDKPNGIAAFLKGFAAVDRVTKRTFPKGIGDRLGQMNLRLDVGVPNN